MPGRLNGASTRISPSLLQKHLIPHVDDKKGEPSSQNDPYKTLFSIPEGEDAFVTQENGTRVAVPPLCHLRRSRTLPASAIRRSGSSGNSLSKREANRSRDDLSVDAPSLKTLKEKFRLESFRRHMKNRNASKKERLPPQEVDSKAQNIYMVPFQRDLPKYPIKLDNQPNEVNMDTQTSSTSPSVESCDPRGILHQKLNVSFHTYENNNQEIVLRASEVSDYQVPRKICYKTEGKNVDQETLENLKSVDTESTNSSSHIQNKPNLKSSSQSDICQQGVITNSQYSELFPTKCKPIPEEESPEANSKRHSFSSSASEVSRLTYGTSTDEGICSIYSETCSSLWSSSASSAASTCSTRVVDKENTCPSTDEGMSVYSCTSSASSYTSSSVSKGAIPKVRTSSFRRCRSGRDSLSRLCLNRSRGLLPCAAQVSDGREVCDRCRREAERGASLKRGGSLRSQKHLPVTPTLLKLLQLVSFQVFTFFIFILYES